MNYRTLAREMGHEQPTEPLILVRPPTSMNAPGREIRLRPGVGRVDHEGELAVVLDVALTGLCRPRR